MSLIFFPMSIGSMSHVDFKKWPCRPVDFKGQGPLPYIRSNPFNYNDAISAMLSLITGCP